MESQPPVLLREGDRDELDPKSRLFPPVRASGREIPADPSPALLLPCQFSCWEGILLFPFPWSGNCLSQLLLGCKKYPKMAFLCKKTPKWRSFLGVFVSFSGVSQEWNSPKIPIFGRPGQCPCWGQGRNYLGQQQDTNPGFSHGIFGIFSLSGRDFGAQDPPGTGTAWEHREKMGKAQNSRKALLGMAAPAPHWDKIQFLCWKSPGKSPGKGTGDSQLGHSREIQDLLPLRVSPRPGTGPA